MTIKRALTLGAFSTALLVPAVAEAAPQWGEGGYVYLAPGSLAFELRNGDLNWQGGVGGGYMWNPDSNFFIGLGGAFSHMLDRPRVDGMMIRAVPEFRIGGGTGRFWFYGLFGPGFGLLFDEDGDDVDAFPAFNFRTAGGAQVLIVKGLFAGLEAWFDFAVFEGGGIYPVGGPRVLIGWYFG